MSAEPSAPRKGASEEVAAAIREHIFAEGLNVGDRLGREEDLARRFGVSRPTLREALRLLASSHLIRATKGPGGGIFMAATPEDGIGQSVSESVASMLSAHSISLGELVETRMLLEIPIAGLAALRATEDDVTALNALLSGGAGRDEVARQLHQRIAAIAGNRLAGAFMQWVATVLQPSLREVIAAAVVDEIVFEQQRDIVRAIERGDPVAAERAMREHLVYLQDVVAAVQP